MNARAASPFSPKMVLALLLFGALTFIGMLYFFGAGEFGGSDNNGGGHAAGKGLNGYAALYELLDQRGYDISRSRNAARLDDEALLILTPPHQADGQELAQIIIRRQHIGPTLIVLPKWLAEPLPDQANLDKKAGWVSLTYSATPAWLKDFAPIAKGGASIDTLKKPAAQWHGLGRSGPFPDPEKVQTLSSPSLITLVRDGRGNKLAGFVDNGGDYPDLYYAAGIEPPDPETADEDTWPVVIVAEPDLLNNYAMADRDRAMLALGLIDSTLDGFDLPIVFDLTLNGLGRKTNLLTLAFTPPFLAATLCLILAALVAGWRAFRRFGPPVVEQPVFAFGKRQLAVNGAELIQRSGRLRLLGAPYAALLRDRFARLLGLRLTGDPHDPLSGDKHIDRMLAARGINAPVFSEQANALRRAHRPRDLLRAANTLKTIERMLKP